MNVNKSKDLYVYYKAESLQDFLQLVSLSAKYKEAF